MSRSFDPSADRDRPVPGGTGAPDPGRIPPSRDPAPVGAPVLVAATEPGAAPRSPSAAATLVGDGDAAFARWLADEAGTWLLGLRARMGHAEPDALRAAGDRGSHELIAAALALGRPGDAVLSEEGVDDPARLAADRVWIVDPLDGTREFGEAERDDWAVHIGLWVRGSSAPFHLAAGAIALPAKGLLLGTEPAPPAAPRWANPRPRVAASRTRMPGFLAAVAREIDAEIIQIGSAGAKIAAVISGEVDAYIHAGGQHEWDSAAPVAVAAAAGLHASRIDGSKLRYNQPDSVLPDLLVCRTGLAPTLVAAIARHI